MILMGKFRNINAASSYHTDAEIIKDHTIRAFRCHWLNYEPISDFTLCTRKQGPLGCNEVACVKLVTLPAWQGVIIEVWPSSNQREHIKRTIVSVIHVYYLSLFRTIAAHDPRWIVLTKSTIFADSYPSRFINLLLVAYALADDGMTWPTSRSCNQFHV